MENNTAHGFHYDAEGFRQRLEAARRIWEVHGSPELNSSGAAKRWEEERRKQAIMEEHYRKLREVSFIPHFVMEGNEEAVFPNDAMKDEGYAKGGTIPKVNMIKKALPNTRRMQCPECREVLFVCETVEELVCVCGQKLKTRPS